MNVKFHIFSPFAILGHSWGDLCLDYLKKLENSYAKLFFLITKQNYVVSHTASKSTFYGLEGFSESLSSSYASYFCALTRVVKIIKDGICWLNQAHGIDLLCPKRYTIWVWSTWELEEKGRTVLMRKLSLLSQFLNVCACASSWTLVLMA